MELFRLLAEVATPEAGVYGALGFAALIVAGAFKALRDQQHDHAEERKEWTAASREGTQAVAALTQAVRDVATLMQMHAGAPPRV